MSDLIDREQALKALRGAEAITYAFGYHNVYEAIRRVPSAEPKKGRWIFARYFVWECSECGKNPTRGMGYTQGKDELFRYCPYCGTEMEVTE